MKTKQILFHFRVVGFSADTCNTMFGQHHSVSTLLKEKIPDIVTIKCSCHSVHLAASYACKCLPEELDEIMRLVYNHFSNSSNRRHRLAAFQEFANVQVNQILSPGQTRWLSLETCVKRLLEQLPALIEYFKEEYKLTKDKSCERINCFIARPITVAYLEMLKYSLGLLNNFNTLFQSESPTLFILKEKIWWLMKTFARNFMNTRYVIGCNISNLDPTLTNQYVPLRNIYFGMNYRIS